MNEVMEKEPARQQAGKSDRVKALEVTFRAADLADAMQLLGGAVDRRTTIPMLNMTHVRHAPTAGMAILSRTDLDITATVEISAEGLTTAGQMSPFLWPDPAGSARAAKLLGAATISVTPMVEVQTFRGVCGAPEREEVMPVAKVRVGALTREEKSQNNAPIADWPSMPSPPDELWRAEVGADFMAALRGVAVAMSEEETRYYLNGVAVHQLGGWTYRLVATDGHRLHWADVRIPGATGRISGLPIICKQMVKALLAHAAKGDEPLTIELLGKSHPLPKTGHSGPVEATHIRASRMMPRRRGDNAPLGRWTITSNLIDGTYPDYGRVVPNSPPLACAVNGREVIAAMAALTAGIKEKAVPIRLGFTGPNDGIAARDPLPQTVMPEMVMAVDSLAAKGEVRVATQGHTMPATAKIGFSSRYLTASLLALGGGNVVLRFLAGMPSHEPVLIEPEDCDVSPVRVVLMPMRV